MGSGGRLGSESWSGVGGVRVGVGRDGVEFVEIQVRGLGSGRSEKLGGWGRRSFGSRGQVEIKEVIGIGE